ncbi:MAG: OmpA family protein [Bdellovibrionia bacterium]
MRKYSQAEVAILLKKENEVWIYSYADLVTNLLAFFLMVIAIQNTNQSTAQAIRDSIAKVTGKGGGKGNVEQEFAFVVTQFFKDARLKNMAAVQKDTDGVSLTFSGGLFFDTLSAELKPEAQDVLIKLAPLLAKLPKDLRVDVGGHSDARPIQPEESDLYPSNWELSAARAAAVVRFLTEKGVDQNRLRAIGYASTQPVSKDFDQNRRVVIRVGKGVVK